MKKNTTCLILILLTFFIFNPSTSRANEATETVKSTVEKVLEVLRDPSLKTQGKEKERKKKIRSLILNRFSFGEMAKRSLAAHWRKLNKEEKKKFTYLFSKMIENSYMRKIETYTNEKITYKDGKQDKKRAIVKTSIITKKGIEIPIHYRLFQTKKGTWKVYDVVIEGVSLISNYRTQFKKIIRSSSYKDLVKQLQAKVGENP